MLENLAQYYSNLVLTSLERVEEQTLPGGLPASAPSQGRHRAELHARPELWTNEVLLATAWRVTCPAEEEWESWGL